MNISKLKVHDLLMWYIFILNSECHCSVANTLSHRFIMFSFYWWKKWRSSLLISLKFLIHHFVYYHYLVHYIFRTYLSTNKIFPLFSFPLAPSTHKLYFLFLRIQLFQDSTYNDMIQYWCFFLWLILWIIMHLNSTILSQMAGLLASSWLNKLIIREMQIEMFEMSPHSP